MSQAHDSTTTCNGTCKDETTCERPLTHDGIAVRAENYCADHEWQASFEPGGKGYDNLVLGLPLGETVRVVVEDIETVSGEWGEQLRITTQFGVTHLQADDYDDIEEGEYEMKSTRDPQNWKARNLHYTDVSQ